MKSFVALVLVLGCGAKQSAPDVVIAHAKAPSNSRPHHVYELGAQRPELDLSPLFADPTEHARWPLSLGSHPVLGPHFDIAAALAEPGVGWLDLCGRGIQNRHTSGNQELLEYLRAWCSVTTHDTAKALYQLGQLAHTIRRSGGLTSAIRTDVANILVDNGSADDAEKLLRRSLIEDLAVVDLLAASYFEVD